VYLKPNLNPKNIREPNEETARLKQMLLVICKNCRRKKKEHEPSGDIIIKEFLEFGVQEAIIG
jgi:predicted metal-binding protein